MLTRRKIRIFVRNKSRYNPETKEQSFLYVDIENFAETTIRDIKEDVRRQCHNTLKIDEIFLINISLANDRSVAHYNMRDGCILESTSNPFWVACLYIKAAEVRQEQQGNPEDDAIQRWTEQSLVKKYILIGTLLNTKNNKTGQPPHFPTLDDLLEYLENLNQKGANMHPDYTQKDMRAFEREYREEFLGRYEDPLAAFIDHHAIRLGYLQPDQIDHRANVQPAVYPLHLPQAAPNEGRHTNMAAGRPRTAGKRKQVPYCEDCEEALAEVYCSDCQPGLTLCRRCSNMLHAGATRRRHQLQGIEAAPANNSNKPYIPRAFLAPFAILLAMFRALGEGELSLHEEEIKRRAQPVTDTDLQDKQIGKYVGGFDCMENVLMAKGLVKKEASRVPTFALTAAGQILGERLYRFETAFSEFHLRYRLPRLPVDIKSYQVNNRKLCLIVDENERDKDRLSQFAASNHIDTQVRQLPTGDYVWILSPPMMNPALPYTGKDYDNELVLPFVVERKSWEDFDNSTRTNRFQRQVNSMLGCGVENCFYLMEGSLSGLRNSTSHQQQRLKSLLEKLTTENGFYVNYTTSWMKSARWLMWFTRHIKVGLNLGKFQDKSITFRDFSSKVARQRGMINHNDSFTQARKQTHVWRSQMWVDLIIRNHASEQGLLRTVQDLALNLSQDKHLVVIQDLEQYNKKRRSTLAKCCEAVNANPERAQDLVEEKLGQTAHCLVHYDVMSFWQLFIQIVTGVYIVRTENLQDTERIKAVFLNGTTNVHVPAVLIDAPTNRAPNRRVPRKKTFAATSTKANDDNPYDTLEDLAYMIPQGHMPGQGHVVPGQDQRIHRGHGQVLPQDHGYGDLTKRLPATFQQLDDFLPHTQDNKENQSVGTNAGHVINRGRKSSTDGSDDKDNVRGVKMADVQFRL